MLHSLVDSAFEREFDWIQFNLFLMRQRFGESVRKAIAIDVSYISKSGKKTPYIGKFWSGCASQVKRGVEILGIGIIDIDSRDAALWYAHDGVRTGKRGRPRIKGGKIDF